MMSHFELDNLSDLDGFVLEMLLEEDASEERLEESCQACHSSRLVIKKGPSLKDWLVSEILEALYSRNIPAPSGASHEEIFNFVKCHFDVPGATAVPPVTPAPSSKKGSAKKKHCPCSSATASHELTDTSVSIPAKWLRVHIHHQNEDPVLAPLSNIQASLNEMETWIQCLDILSTCTPQNTSPQPRPSDISPATMASGLAVPVGWLRRHFSDIKREWPQIVKKCNHGRVQCSLWCLQRRYLWSVPRA